MPSNEFGEALRVADMLADFANLTPESAQDFRQRYPDFAPGAWWDTNGRLGDGPVVPEWIDTQQRLRDAWRDRFPPDACIRLIGDWSNFAWWGQQAQQTNDLIQSGDEAALMKRMEDPSFFVQPRALTRSAL